MFLNNQNGHGYPSLKDWLKVLGVVVTTPISIPVILLKEKIKKKKEEKNEKN